MSTSEKVSVPDFACAKPLSALTPSRDPVLARMCPATGLPVNRFSSVPDRSATARPAASGPLDPVRRAARSNPHVARSDRSRPEPSTVASPRTGR